MELLNIKVCPFLILMIIAKLPSKKASSMYTLTNSMFKRPISPDDNQHASIDLLQNFLILLF